MSEPETFADGYPAQPGARDYAIHAAVGADLENCRQLQGTYANQARLYPGCFAAAPHSKGAWLDAALARAEWHAGREPWNGYLSGLINLLLGEVKETGDGRLLKLSRLGPLLYDNGGSRVCRRLPEALDAALGSRKSPLPPELSESLGTLVEYLVSIHDHGPHTFGIAWRLFRAPEAAADGDPCFSAQVRRDLRAMAPAEAARWEKLWAAIDHRWSLVSAERPAQERLRAAVEGIGTARFCERLASWIGRLESQQPAWLSAAGMTLLRHLVVTCRGLPEAPLDEPLHRFCGVRWEGGSANRFLKEWIGSLLVTLASRAPDRAFACAERLAHNPDTSGFAEVQKFYSQRLGEVVSEAAPSQAETGADGFPFSADPERRAEQTRIDGFLRETRLPTAADFANGRQTAAGGKEMLMESILRQPAGGLPQMVRAVAVRARWQAGRRAADPHQDLLWRSGMGELLCNLLRAKPDLTTADLALLCEVDALGYLALAPSSMILERAEDFVSREGFSPELAAALERWMKTLHGSNSAMDLRHKASWLLWFEDRSPIQLGDCWSHRIRAALRAMNPKTRSAWEALLRNISFATGEKPPSKWKKPAAKAMQAVGGAEFRARMREWFAPFRDGETLRITVIGRDVLRNLMWYALPAADPEVDEALSWFGSAKWKTKDDKARISKLLPSFAYVIAERSPQLALRTLDAFHKEGPVPLAGKTLQVYERLCAQLGRAAPPREPDTPKPSLGDVMHAALRKNLTGPNTSIEGDDLVVQGKLDTYRISMKDSRMVRVSDGKPVRIELDLAQPGLSALRAMLDGADIQNPFAPNYFRLLMCAQILSRDVLERDRILVDES